MTDTLAAEYPEATRFIEEAVDEHGEDWVLENYYKKIYPLKQVMAVPEKEELPFYDEAEHEAMTEAERTEMYQAWGEYRENLRTGTKPDG
jgi:ribosomal protein S3AE